MAAPAKRARVSDASPLAAPCPVPRAAARAPLPLPAGPSGREPESDAVAGFLRWCTRVGLELSPKVMVSRQGTVAGYGMVARESVQPGELLFAVPRSALLSPHTCSISDLLERGTEDETERLLLRERWDFLCKQELVGEEGAFVIGREEVLTEEELATTLKVLCMPAEEFRDYKERAGWGEEETEDGSLAVTNIPKLRESWKRLLRDSVLLTLQTYGTDLKTEQDLLSNKEVYAKLSWREQQALQVRYGQKMILHRLLELTS